MSDSLSPQENPAKDPAEADASRLIDELQGASGRGTQDGRN
jgi:hypothetical protein